MAAPPVANQGGDRARRGRGDGGGWFRGREAAAVALVCTA
jgi:hypothetical protein